MRSVVQPVGRFVVTVHKDGPGGLQAGSVFGRLRLMYATAMLSPFSHFSPQATETSGTTGTSATAVVGVTASALFAILVLSLVPSFAAVAFVMLRLGPARAPAVFALLYWPAFRVDVMQLAVTMRAPADSMTFDARRAGPFLAINDRHAWECVSTEPGPWRARQFRIGPSRVPREDQEIASMNEKPGKNSGGIFDKVYKIEEEEE